MHQVHAHQTDLNLLATLDVLIDEGNVTRAAARLGISQSALSHRLARLRELFDDPLLVQGRAGMVATARALALRGPVARGLRELEAALQLEPRFDPATSERRFVVASADYGEFLVLPAVLERLGVEAPGVELVMVPPDPDVLGKLERGTIDLAISAPLGPAAGLMQRRVLSGEFMVAARADHPAIGEHLDLDTYLALPHLLISPSGAGPGIVDHELAKLGLRRRIAARVRSFTAAPFVAAQSDVLVTGPGGLLHHVAAFVRLRVFEPPLALPPVDPVMSWHERWNDDPGHRWLRELSAAVMAEVDRRAPSPTKPRAKPRTKRRKL